MSDSTKIPCYVCGVKPARRLNSVYAISRSDPIFCGWKCAGNAGLNFAATQDEHNPEWCSQHGWAASDEHIGCKLEDTAPDSTYTEMMGEAS